MRYLFLYLALCCGLIAQTTKVGGTGTTKVGGTGTTKVGANAPTGPAFVREALRTTVEGGFASVVVLPLTGTTTIPSGHRAVLALAVAQTITVSSLTDDAGNTWAVDLTGSPAGQSGIAICSSPLGFSLAASNNITITFSSTAAFPIAVSLNDLSGTAGSGQPDSTAGVSTTFATSVSIPGTTIASNTVAIGVLTNDNNGTYTYSGSAWTIIGTGTQYSSGASRICNFVTKTFSAAGAQDPGGTWTTGNINQVNGWAAYK